LQPLSLQPDLWCSQVLRKQGFLTLQALQVLSHPETPWALGVGAYWDEANTVCLCFLNGQSLWILHLAPQGSSQPPDTYSVCGAVITSDWLEPENVVCPVTGHTGMGVEDFPAIGQVVSGVEITVEVTVPDSDPPLTVGDGSVGPRVEVGGGALGTGGLG
jgi:hypothetical protein